MLGYFRDPDIAFVVGPQVYGNYDAAVTKAAESQQFLFHALIQRACAPGASGTTVTISRGGRRRCGTTSVPDAVRCLESRTERP